MLHRIPEVPPNLDLLHQQFLQAVKGTLENIVPSTLPPSPASGLIIHPLPGANQVLFTGSPNADKHIILTSPTPTWDPTKADNHAIDIGESTTYIHTLGRTDARYYWVVASRGGTRAPAIGPIKSTPLALGTPAAAVPFIPPARNLTRSLITGKPTIPRIFRTTRNSF